MTADELRREIAEVKQRISDLMRTEYESLPAEEQEDYVQALGEAEDRLRDLERELAELESS